ncbi:DUF1194 domain-containing protein [Marinibacterium profundimaris]|uniref:VWFA domain-containing protein n=1 Tax=Marinibacterium profundimaris TaxID=1679460 RepID=A0A225NSR2_9RHOB|nr:DUF1194 domain-containing protein [Marinibacterium profundimaris]OWU77859.1 hypothetical protein ATO3_04280 [Marinibacterium profundimaris]
MRIFIAIAAVLIGLRPALAQDIEVDVELVLAADVSRSMSPHELEIQRRGYAEAIASDEVMGTIGNGMIGRIAVTFMEWAGSDLQTVVVPWTLIDSREDAQAVADLLTAEFHGNMRRTSISSALTQAATLFDDNGFRGLRRIIDVSGDGPNNSGSPVVPARDAVLARGIIINGLPLMTTDGFSYRWGIEDLDVYYLNCVIGGPGAFVIPVHDWSEFAEAVRRKLVLEIAGGPGGSDTATLRRANGYDCLVGEKIWQRNRTIWMEP